jgi:PAS domain S-box-containing protein
VGWGTSRRNDVTLLLEQARLKHISEALGAASKVLDTTGEVFFRSLTEHLNAVLHVDYVSIGELSDDGRRCRTVAVSAGGKNLENLEYELDHTPCQLVLERGRYFDHRDLQSHFPLDEFLVQMGFESYLGVALVDSTGVRLGVMSVLSRQPLADPQTAELTLGLFAARTSVEMERRRSERALQASEARNRAILQAIPDVIFVLDRECRVLDYAANNGNGFYATPEHVVGEKIGKRLPADAAESVARAVEHTSKSAQPSSATFSLQTAKGTCFYDSIVVPYDADTILMIVRDVTTHKQAALDLEKSNRFFQQLGMTIPGVLFVYDLVEKRNLYVNQAGSRMLGYTAEEFLTMGDRFLETTLHPEDLARLPALAEEYARATEGEVFTHLFRMRHKSGEWRWVHRTATVFAWAPDGRPHQLVGTSVDVTELKAAEEELRTLPARLLNAQDQERRRIARELHDTTAQNLTGLGMNLKRLERAGVSPEAAQILADCRTLCDTSLQEIRTLSYLLHPPMLDEVGLVSALRWYVDGLETRSGLRVTLDAPPETERLPAALERDLFAVVQEAILNVVRHSGSDTAEVRLERQAAHIVLQIRDHGRGVSRVPSPENIGDRAFVGVGIPSMRERLRQNGGGLEILSNDQGTTLVATVPLQAEMKDSPMPGTVAPRGGR